MPYVYVLYSLKDGQRYTGVCERLWLRLDAHRRGRVPATRYRRPLLLIYYEWCARWADARRREQYLKTSGGKRYLKNRVRTHLAELEGKRKPSPISSPLRKSPEHAIPPKQQREPISHSQQ